ncbi:MAG: SUMF1/EgtB/PvdO family nonheme iron enzyme [Flexilinea sp.]|nr:SUMF1/EgtB/PvdO family nonheme iron enzyme [Flexilinea sp.]
MKSYINLFRNYANFSGFLKRKPYWTAVLIHLLILLIPLVPGIFFLLGKSDLLPEALDLADPNGILTKIYIPWVLPIWACYFLLTRIPLLSAAVRRFHTLPRKGWWLLIGLIPVAGWFIVFIWLLQKGNFEDIERRLRRAGMDNDLAHILKSALLSAAEKPRAGGWFFAALALIAAGGFFLNRQVKQSEPVMAAVRDIQSGAPVDLASLGLFDGKKTADVSVKASVSDAPVYLLEPEEGKSITAIKDNSELLMISDSVMASKYAVTYGQYAACADAGGCEMPALVSSEAYKPLDKNLFRFLQENGLKIAGYFDLLGQKKQGYAKDLPMVDVTAEQAAAYCSWAGMRLPTETEWMKAAEGAALSAKEANFIDYPDRWIMIRDNAQKKAQVAQTIPVTWDEKYASDSGIVGMTGNVWEWTVSDDGADTVQAMGGAWNSYAVGSVDEAVMKTLPGYAANNIGFRCFADTDKLASNYFKGGRAIEEITADEIEADVILTDVLADVPAPAEELEIKTAMQQGAAPVMEADLPSDTSVPVNEAAYNGPESQLENIASRSEKKKKDTESLEEPDEKPEPTGANAVSLTGEPLDDLGGQIRLTEGASVIALADHSILKETEGEVLAALYAVTVGQYKQCAEEGACEMPDALDKLAYPGMVEKNKAENLPMVYVTREQAAAYCEWAGMRLPTADEWRAAAEPADGKKLSERNVNSVGTNRKNLLQDAAQMALTVPVNSFRRDNVSVYGMVQMAGNVWEWTAPEEDSEAGIALGGAWNSYPDAVGAEAELETMPGYAADNVGFRCFVSADALTEDRFELSEASPSVLAHPELWKDEGLRVKDDAEMVFIAGTTFGMGVPNGALDEKPVHDVTLSDYWIDAYEVTNAQYALCVEDGACTVPHETKSFRNASYYDNPDFADYPVIAVDRSQAEAYCTWAETRLPTEAEWEYAAKGPEGTTYPWGNTLGTEMNYASTGNYDTLAVTANPDDVSSQGVYNLGGNVSEWVLDRYDETWYTKTDQPVDPTGPTYGNYYVIRGGSAQTGENNARTGDRFYGLNTSYSLDRGFRCAVSEDAE